MEIIGINSNLIFHRRQSVCLTDAMWNKTGIIDILWHVPFIAGEKYHVFEINISGL